MAFECDCQGILDRCSAVETVCLQMAVVVGLEAENLQVVAFGPGDLQIVSFEIEDMQVVELEVENLEVDVGGTGYL